MQNFNSIAQVRQYALQRAGDKPYNQQTDEEKAYFYVAACCNQVIPNIVYNLRTQARYTNSQVMRETLESISDCLEQDEEL